MYFRNFNFYDGSPVRKILTADIINIKLSPPTSEISLKKNIKKNKMRPPSAGQIWKKYGFPKPKAIEVSCVRESPWINLNHRDCVQLILEGFIMYPRFHRWDEMGVTDACAAQHIVSEFWRLYAGMERTTDHSIWHLVAWWHDVHTYSICERKWTVKTMRRLMK